ncbi:transposase, partial [Mycobacterium tuberculosis]
TLNARDQPPAEVSDQRVSGLTGAVHSQSRKLTRTWSYRPPPLGSPD